MPIPNKIKIKNKMLPDSPGVYFYYDSKGRLLYIGKATSLKSRVGSYFNKAHDNRIAELVSKIARIDYIETPTVIEALVLEANKIKALQPYYNILQLDDKSFLYLVITNEAFPKPILMRGHELDRLDINPFDSKLSKIAQKKFLAVFGPYTSSVSVKRALDLIRRIIPWTTCEPPSLTGKTRPCFDRHIRKCPGVCTGEISKSDYRKIITKLILFFSGKKVQLLRQLEREMKQASKNHEFEVAAQIRNQIFALKHIRDVALITKEDVELPFSQMHVESTINLEGRIEAYDISNIGGTSSVGSMVVFEEGRPVKSEYRKFKIKTVNGINDTAMLEEVIRRRLRRAELYPQAWPLPELMVVDGGKGQVNRAQLVLDEFRMDLPVLGIAKGFDRKQDRLVYDPDNIELARVASRGKELFQKARDEAHRFAVAYHRKLRGKASGMHK
ncbi:MAG: excinuclease ABC subunit UvrC [Candidatus Uhrbacteria bacterium]|nr:excinuclease ABC subunit UvrC [Candidatus Uhrbacteria bacterium]